ncbi:MAG: hypothetical protein GC164_01810 [Phycisphaera sp.]|nr:hypothetical protein [Phycisphaera sp.]
MDMKKNKLVRQLTADKKKLSMMVGLLCVGMLLWGRLLLKQVPRTALAVPKTAASAVVNPDPIDAGSATVKRVVVDVTIPADPGRDLFAWDPTRYPKVLDNQAVAEAGKLGPQRTDEVREADMQAQAKKSLTLQSTVLGARPWALINGKVLLVGQEIEGFKLIEVLARGVIVEKESLRVQLEM